LSKRVRLLISGHVQGVWFRASVKEEADRLGVSGWVRNRRSGHVEVTAEGEDVAIDELIAWCRVGSRGASVAHVGVARETYRGEFDDFIIERTI
jgi:acylphosphatase